MSRRSVLQRCPAEWRLQAARPTKASISCNDGNALIVTMVAIAVVMMAVGTALRSTSSTVRLSDRANDYVTTEKATEGAIEYAYGVWKQRLLHQDRALKKSQVGLESQPTFPGSEYIPGEEVQITPVDAFGAPLLSGDATPTPVAVLLQEYPGWRGLAFTYMASTRMRSLTAFGQAPQAGAKRMFQYVQVPLFQSMYFFEHDLEIFFPAEMIVGGLVHSNSRLLLSGRDGNSLTFSGNVSHVGGYTSKIAPLGGPEWAGLSRDNAEKQMRNPIYTVGYDAQVSQVNRYEPLGSKPAKVLNPNDDNPNNDSFRELIEPPVLTDAGGNSVVDDPQISKRRLFNKAGIVIEINGNAINITAKNGTVLDAAGTDNLKKAIYKQNSTTAVDRVTIHDEREGKKVDIVNVNVAQLTATIGSTMNFNGVIYVHDVTPNSASDPEPRAVRLQNGGRLPDTGLTIVSQNPVYIQGDYNTGTTTSPTAVPANSTGNPNNTDLPVTSNYTRKPAAVIADAVMFLSNNWKDVNAAEALSKRAATNTTYNTAIMAGFLPSGWDPDGETGPKAAYGYSGGANNFPRFLENWSNKTCTYYGSMVELFQSETFTGMWTTGDVFSPPKRRWNYDTLFTTNPPPGGVDAVTFSRGAWMKY